MYKQLVTSLAMIFISNQSIDASEQRVKVTINQDDGAIDSYKKIQRKKKLNKELIELMQEVPKYRNDQDTVSKMNKKLLDIQTELTKISDEEKQLGKSFEEIEKLKQKDPKYVRNLTEYLQKNQQDLSQRKIQAENDLKNIKKGTPPNVVREYREKLNSINLEINNANKEIEELKKLEQQLLREEKTRQTQIKNLEIKREEIQDTIIKSVNGMMNKSKEEREEITIRLKNMTQELRKIEEKIEELKSLQQAK